MTKEQLEQKAKEHVDEKFSLKYPSQTLRDGYPVESTVGECKQFCKNDYVAEANMVISSPEYVQMKADADNWNNYNEELKSMQDKLSIQWEKVEKWYKLTELIHEIDNWKKDHSKEQAWIAKGKIAEGYIGTGFAANDGTEEIVNK